MGCREWKCEVKGFDGQQGIARRQAEGRYRESVVASLAVVALVWILACSALPGPREVATPAPTLAATETPIAAGEMTPTPRPLPTMARATPTAGAAAPTSAPVTPTTPASDLPGDQTTEFYVTEADLEQMVNSDQVQEQVQTENFDATMTGGRLIMTVDRLQFGMLNLGPLRVVGTIVARDGVAHFQAESVEPNNLLTAAVPGLLDRVLTSSTAGFYVESVEIQEGRIVYKVRPR